MYSLYLDGVLMPIAPEKIQRNIKNQNKTINLLNDGEINILKSPGLTDFSFDLVLPQQKYPFARYVDGFKTADYFLEKLNQLKTEKKSFRFLINRIMDNGFTFFSNDLMVSIEDYSIIDDVQHGFDIVVNLKLKQYKTYGLQTFAVTEKTENTTVATVQKQREKPTVPTQKTYVTKDGDDLWSIAQRFYEDGSKYTVIWNKNKSKITNPRIIPVGLKLVL